MEITKYQQLLMRDWDHFHWIRRILIHREWRRDPDFFAACIEEWHRNRPQGTHIIVRPWPPKEILDSVKRSETFKRVISQEELKAFYENTKKTTR